MKDAPHHLKHIQKKVIQSVRRENAQNGEAKLNGYQNGTTVSGQGYDLQEKAQSGRVPRISGRVSLS